MRQKYKITRKRSLVSNRFLFYGYKYLFFNLIPIYVSGSVSSSFEECKRITTAVELLEVKVDEGIVI